MALRFLVKLYAAAICWIFRVIASLQTKPSSHKAGKRHTAMINEFLLTRSTSQVSIRWRTPVSSKTPSHKSCSVSSLAAFTD